MARTSQRSTGRQSGARGARRPVRLPKSTRSRRSSSSGFGAKVLRGTGILFLFVCVAGIAFAAGGYLGLVRSVERLGEPQSVETHPTYIYSAPLGGNEDSRRVIGTAFQGVNRKTATLGQMPPSLLNALVAKEDERFMQHGGVDLWGIMRALYVDVQAGETVEGASTITQQYVKNAYLTHDQTWVRKLKEALIAVEIERKNDDKNEILADYLNTVYFGSNAYGVEAAAETYFNESVGDLSIAESATLVGLLWSPSTLGANREEAGVQRDLVLEKMFDAGYITEQDYTKALESPLPQKWPMAPTVASGLTGPALTRDFTELVEEELISRYGANTVFGGDISVYTTIDLEAQATAREILYGPAGYLPNETDPDAALVSIDPETGHVKAMVGNRDESAQFNLVTQGKRQPGSSFKPFALIAALEQGIDPETKFVSEKKEYELDVGLDKPETWKVRNYDRIERGRITLREALWYSDNTVFTDLVMNTEGQGLDNGPEKVVDVARRLGIKTEFPSQPHPSVVLGTQEVSPLEMAAAYATIANDGRRVEPTVISRVVSDRGRSGEEVIYEAPPEPEGEQVVDPEVAREATGIMIGDVTRGIAEDAALEDRPVAGKTGTSENFFDAWFLGYTPQLTTGIWMGYGEGGQTLEYVLDYARELHGLSGGVTPAQIWQSYMEEVLDRSPVEDFEGVEVPKEATTRRKSPTAAREKVPSPNRGRQAPSAATAPAAAPATAPAAADPAY
jgi:membrane peptidoglycan carboxypeptidase